MRQICQIETLSDKSEDSEEDLLFSTPALSSVQSLKKYERIPLTFCEFAVDRAFFSVTL